MTTDTPNLDWLDQAEAKLAADRAEDALVDEAFAMDLARDVNAALAELGIVPVTPASTDGEGRLVPALLVGPDVEKRFYGVHAGYDEDEGVVGLLVSDYESGPAQQFEGTKPSTISHLTAVVDVLRARRHGPARVPAPVPPLSREVQAIVNALDELRVAVESVARSASRP